MRSIRIRISPSMTARFFDAAVHPVYATFAIVEHAEYLSRVLIRGDLEEGEDAVGSAVEIRHVGPARVGEIVTLEGEVRSIEGRKIICDVRVHVDGREVAEVVTEQVRLPKERVREMMGGTGNDAGLSPP